MRREMKDSGVEWIGEIPEGLTAINTKYLLDYQKGKNPETLNSENKGLPYIGASDLEKNGEIHSYSNYCEEELPIAVKDDVLVLWDGARAGLIGTGHLGYIASTVSKITPRTDLINKRFWWWYLKGMQPVLLDWVGGTTIPHMNRDFIYQLKIVGFKQDEQKKIAAFLDYTISQIDSIIERTKETIADYKLLKQSIITEAVTKGLDKNVGMKDSGIEWIGQIPEKWEITKFGRAISNTMNGLTRRNQTSESVGTIVLRIKDISQSRIDYSDVNRIPLTGKEIVNYSLKEGDILFVRVNGSKKLVGKNAIFYNESEIVAFNDHIIKIQLNDMATPEFITWVLNSYVGEEQISKYIKTSAGQYTISGVDLKKLIMIFPPLIEQDAISKYLSEKCLEIDLLITQKLKLTEDLETYKKSLIYEYVTGKKEVME